MVKARHGVIISRIFAARALAAAEQTNLKITPPPTTATGKVDKTLTNYPPFVLYKFQNSGPA